MSKPATHRGLLCAVFECLLVEGQLFERDEMPTGYTAAIADGLTFEQFAMQCSRAFGALVTMRDEPTDAPIPDHIAPESYYQEWLEREHVELNRLLSFTEADIEREAEAEYQRQVEAHAERMKTAADLRAKYESMLASVNAWAPPTAEHQGLKDFMIQQITESIRFDCNTSYDEPPQRKAPAKWIADKLEHVRGNLALYESENRKEVERAASRTAWIQALRASLK